MPRTYQFFDGIDYARPDALDATVYASVRAHRPGRHRGLGKPMFTMKDDDSTITWDAEAMAQRPFRPAKEQPVNCVHSWRK